MTYIYECDGWCDDEFHDERPALTGEFGEEFYRGTKIGGLLNEHGYEQADLVTLCPDCVQRLLLET